MDKLRKQFSHIFDKHIDKIYRFIFLKVNSQDVAQDLTSETFLRCWEKYRQNQERIENINAFLYQIARNLVIDHYREKGKNQVFSAEDTPIIDPREDVGQKATLNLDVEQIKVSLVNLKEDYQNVIIWHYLDDLPIKEVSLMLDRSEEATRVLLHRALNALRDQLKIESKEV